MKFGQATVTLKKQAGSAEPTHKMSNNQRAIDPIPVWSKHSYCDCTDIKNVQPQRDTTKNKNFGITPVEPKAGLLQYFCNGFL